MNHREQAMVYTALALLETAARSGAFEKLPRMPRALARLREALHVPAGAFFDVADTIEKIREQGCGQCPACLAEAAKAN